jgi:WD40 repeat protein
VLNGHSKSVDAAVFSPDGVRIATASEDNTARVWDSVEAVDPFAVACAGLGNETDLADLAHRYGLGELKPICGLNAPNKVNRGNMQD